MERVCILEEDVIFLHRHNNITNSSADERQCVETINLQQGCPVLAHNDPLFTS